MRSRWKLVVFAASFIYAGDFANWPAGTEVTIRVKEGNTTSAWLDRYDYLSTATATVGDGTFELRIDLVPGAIYNYIFFASNAAEGYNGWYAEPVPDGSRADTIWSAAGGVREDADPGTFVYTGSTTTAFDPASVNALNGYVSYVSIGGDARRLLQMPDVTSGATVFIFNNFASMPRGAANLSAIIKSPTRVDLYWSGALGTWGAGSPSLDILGGRWLLYVSSGTGANPGQFSLITSLPGNATFYSHPGLTTGTTYWYIFVASDTYAGTRWGGDGGNNTDSGYTGFTANLVRWISGSSVTWNSNQYVSNDTKARPQNPTPVYFRVENEHPKYYIAGFNYDYVKEHDNVVYLTPVGYDARTYPHKIPATIIAVYIPPEKS